MSKREQNDQEPIIERIDMVDPAFYANDSAFTPSLSRVRPYYKSNSGFARASFFSFFHVDLREQWDKELFLRGIDRSSSAHPLIKGLSTTLISIPPCLSLIMAIFISRTTIASTIANWGWKVVRHNKIRTLGKSV